MMPKLWWVYVLRSEAKRYNKQGKELPGVYYVGSTTDVPRRLLQHGGFKPGGGKYTARFRPWKIVAVYGPYENRSEAFRAEMVLKHSKRGQARTQWTPEDSQWCRGAPGTMHPWVWDLSWQPGQP